MKLISRIEDWTVIISFIAIVVITFLNVIFRYVLQASLAFTEEITINTLVVFTLAGAVIGIRNGAHLGFTYVVENSPRAIRKALIVASAVAMILFLIILLYFGGEMTINQAIRGRATPSLGIPQWLFTIAIPLCGLLGAFHILTGLKSSLRSSQDEEDVVARLAATTAGATQVNADHGSESGEDK